LLLLFKFITNDTTESFVSRTNALLVGTFIEIGDDSVGIAIKFQLTAAQQHIQSTFFLSVAHFIGRTNESSACFYNMTKTKPTK